jgi:hypothetical protein
MRLKVREIGKGLHPSEVVVEVSTSTGKERVVVDIRSLTDGSISVGSPLGKKGQDTLLVELPREAMSGTWRVWVKERLLVPEMNPA